MKSSVFCGAIGGKRGRTTHSLEQSMYLPEDERS